MQHILLLLLAELALIIIVGTVLAYRGGGLKDYADEEGHMGPIRPGAEFKGKR